MSKNNKASSPSLKRNWFQELKAEFAKITWPTKNALAKKSTGDPLFDKRFDDWY